MLQSSVTTSTRLQRAISFASFTRCKQNPVYCTQGLVHTKINAKARFSRRVCRHFMGGSVYRIPFKTYHTISAHEWLKASYFTANRCTITSKTQQDLF